MVAGTGELSRYKTCLKKTGRANTLVSEVTRFDGKKLDIVDSIGDRLDDINEACDCSVSHSFGWNQFKVLVLQLRRQKFLHSRSKVPARSCKAFVNWTTGRITRTIYANSIDFCYHYFLLGSSGFKQKCMDGDVVENCSLKE